MTKINYISKSNEECQNLEERMKELSAIFEIYTSGSNELFVRGFGPGYGGTVRVFPKKGTTITKVRAKNPLKTAVQAADAEGIWLFLYDNLRRSYEIKYKWDSHY